jgi:hypothetical protein
MLQTFLFHICTKNLYQNPISIFVNPIRLIELTPNKSPKVEEKTTFQRVNIFPHTVSSSTDEPHQSLVFKDAYSSIRTRVILTEQPNTVSNATGHVPSSPDQRPTYVTFFTVPAERPNK